MKRRVHIEIGTCQPVSIVDPTTGDTLGNYATVIDAYHVKALMEGNEGISSGPSGIRTNLKSGCIEANPITDIAPS